MWEGPGWNLPGKPPRRPLASLVIPTANWFLKAANLKLCKEPGLAVTLKVSRKPQRNGAGLIQALKGRVFLGVALPLRQTAGSLA